MRLGVEVGGVVHSMSATKTEVIRDRPTDSVEEPKSSLQKDRERVQARMAVVRNGLAVVGLALIVGGIAAWSRPAASIVLGGLFLLFVYVTSK